MANKGLGMRLWIKAAVGRDRSDLPTCPRFIHRPFIRDSAIKKLWMDSARY